MRLNAKQICEYTGGQYLVEAIDSGRLASNISWDSRNVSPQDVYVALPGDHVDGHKFIADALRAGCPIVICSERPDETTLLLAQEMGAALIEVSNTYAAITDMAAAWRKKLKGHVIAVTGSSGKTSTKNLIRDVLKQKFSVVATAGNQNNELGVPKTILTAEIDTQAVVVEMGMRGSGQITDLCEFVCPDMGLITNIGDAHIELLGSREHIARAKAELFEALPEGRGVAFVNRDDEYAELVMDTARLHARRVKTFYYDGSEKAALRVAAHNSADDALWAAWAHEIELDERGFPRFTLHVGAESARTTVPLQGLHTICNACAAASVGAALGMDIEQIVYGLEHAEPEVGRQETLMSREGATIINDSYNANPDSMRAALMMFAAIKSDGRHIAVLGDMGELGDFAEPCHRDIGALVASLSFDRLVCIGDLSAHIAAAAEEAGMDSARIIRCATIPDVIVDLEDYVCSGDAVLIKASRFMELERVVGGLVN